MALDFNDPKVQASADSLAKEVGLSGYGDLADAPDSFISIFRDKLEQRLSAPKESVPSIAGKWWQNMMQAALPADEAQRGLEKLGLSPEAANLLSGPVAPLLGLSNMLSGVAQSVEQRGADILGYSGLTPKERVVRAAYTGTGDILPSLEAAGAALGAGKLTRQETVPAVLDMAALVFGPKIASKILKTGTIPKSGEPPVIGGIEGEFLPNTVEAPPGVNPVEFQKNPIFSKIPSPEELQKAAMQPVSPKKIGEVPITSELAKNAPSRRPPDEYSYNKNYVIRGNNLADLNKLISEKEVGTGQTFFQNRPSEKMMKALESMGEMSPEEMRRAKFSQTSPTESGSITGEKYITPKTSKFREPTTISNEELQGIANRVDGFAPSSTDAAGRFTTVATPESVQPSPPPGWQVNLAYALKSFEKYSKIPEALDLYSRMKFVYANTAPRIGWARDLARQYGFTGKFSDINPLARLSPEERANAWEVRERGAEPISPNVTRAVQWWDEVAKRAASEIQASGRFPDFKTRNNYLPRGIKPELLNQFYNDVETIRKHGEQVAMELDAEKGITTPDVISEQRMADIFDKHFDPANFPAWIQETMAGAKAKFEQSTGTAMSRILRYINDEYWNPYGSTDFQWHDAIPEKYIDKDFSRITWNYVHKYARRLSEAEQFGANGEIGSRIIADLYRKSTQAAEFADGVLKRFLHVDRTKFFGSKQLEKAMRMNADWSYLTKIIFNLKVNAQQLLQTGASSGIEVGFWRQLRANSKLLLEQEPALTKSIDKSGILDTDAFSIHTGYESTLRQDFHTLGSLFGEENLLNKRLAYAQYREYFQNLWNLAHNSSILPFRWAKEGRAQWAQKTLAEKGIDWKEPLTDDVVIRGAYNDATRSQLQPNVLEEPGYWTNPHIKPLLLFKRATLKQFKFTANVITNEMKRGNAAPLLRAFLAGGIGGELANIGLNYYYSALRGETVYREEDTILKRFINDMAAFWTFGWMTDALATQTKDENIQAFRDFLLRTVSPVIVGFGGSDVYGNKALSVDTPLDKRMDNILSWIGSNVIGATIGSARARLRSPAEKTESVLYKRGQVVERAAKAKNSPIIPGTGLPLFSPNQRQIIENWNRHHAPHLWIVMTNKEKTYGTQASLEDFYNDKINAPMRQSEQELYHQTGVR